MSHYIAIGCILIVGGLSSFLVARILTARLEESRKEAAVWECVAKEQQATIEQLTAAQEVAEAALVERERELGKLKANSAKRRAVLVEASRADKSTREWGEAPVPQAVRDVLDDTLPDR